MRAAKYAGVPVTEALGVPWSIWVERWCLIAESAEAQAQEQLSKEAQRKQRH